MNELDHQKVLAGVDQWDRPLSRHLDEAKAHKTKTAGYLASAMEALQKAKRAAGHRKLRKGNKSLHTALTRAHEACKRAHEQCYQHGETYEVEDFTEDERQVLMEEADPALDKPLQRLRKRFKHLKTEVGDIERLVRKNSDGVWDPMEGAVLDAQDALTGMLNIVKKVNQYRDKRRGQ